MAKTKIAWAEAVWNPTIGCTRVSEGCRNCYAERMAARLEMMHKPEYGGLLTSAGRWNGEVKLLDERLGQPLRWKKPRRIFVDSMSDLFHEAVPFEFIDKVFGVMGRSQQHRFMILTKRPHRMLEYFQTTGLYRRILGWAFNIDGSMALSNAQIGNGISNPVSFPWENVWLGISAEDQKTWDQRYPILLRIPAALRFASLEPLLNRIDMGLGECPVCGGCGETAGHYSMEDGMDTCDACGGSGRTTDTVDWVICGGESGPEARATHPEWVRSIRDQCQDAGVPFFFKQWGEWFPKQEPQPLSSMAARGKVPIEGNISVRLGKRQAGNLLDGQKWEEYPHGTDAEED